MKYNILMQSSKLTSFILDKIMVLVLLWVCLAVLPGCSGTGQESASVPGNSIPSSLPGGADSSPYQADALDPAVEDGIAEVEVVEVIDGDTIRILLGGRVQKLRFIGVDSPELNHPARGEEPLASSARDFTRTRLAGQTIRLEFDVEKTDQYGRLLGYIWLGDELFNETLLKEGYAQVVTFPPNVKYTERFRLAQQIAIQNGHGLWSQENQANVDGKKTYVGSLQSNKYHFPDCKWAQQIAPERQIWFSSPSEAAAAGYEPCGTCSP